MNRRSFLQLVGGGIAAAISAPAVITTPGLLMPVKTLWKPRTVNMSFDMFDGRIWWIHNDGLAVLTVSGIELPDRWEPTPRPIEVQPGEALAFQSDVRVWSRWIKPYEVKS